MKISLYILACLACVLSAPAAIANYDGDRGDSGGGSGVTMNNRTTRALIRQIDHDFGECLQLFEAYRFDCFRKTYGNAANKIKSSLDYRPAYEALKQLETRIDTAVNANIDPEAKRIRKGFQRFSAVKPSAVPALKRETERALEEAKTVLLRSPTPHQKPHFQKIAAVLDSNKVLLRSALLLAPAQLYRLAQGIWNRRSNSGSLLDQI